MKNMVHEGGPGTKMPWTNNSGGDVAAGAIVVLKHCIGVAAVAIPNGGIGTVYVEGVVSGVVKANGHAWAQGERLNWDVSASAFDYSGAAAASGDIVGGVTAWLPALAGDVVGVVRLSSGGGVLTP